MVDILNIPIESTKFFQTILVRPSDKRLDSGVSPTVITGLVLLPHLDAIPRVALQILALTADKFRTKWR